VTAHHEAETSPAACSGTIDTNWPGCTGTGFYNGEHAVGASARFAVTSSTAGSATVVVRFANDSKASRPVDVFVKGTKVRSVSFEVTGAWSTWASATLAIPLPAGTSTLQFTPTTAEGLPNIDSVCTTYGAP